MEVDDLDLKWWSHVRGRASHYGLSTLEEAEVESHVKSGDVGRPSR